MWLLSGRAARNAARRRETVHSDAPAIHGAALAAAYYGHRIGGEFYDFVRVGPNRLLFGLLDVAGRHEDNHAIVNAAKQTFRTRGLELFADDEVNEADAMIELSLEINRSILQRESGVHACPAFAGCYHESLGTVCYFNAGHTPGLVRDSAGVAELPATGLPLGLFSHTTCDARTIGLEPGAALLLVSRGIVEGTRRKQELGLRGVKALLQRAKAETPKQICLDVLQGVEEFMGRPAVHNDMTTLALVRAGQAAAVAAN